jgi:hypothetical protein
MIVFGSNIPIGKGVEHSNGKTEKPPWIIGLGVGLTRSDFQRVEKPEGPFEKPRDERGEPGHG